MSSSPHEPSGDSSFDRQKLPSATWASTGTAARSGGHRGRQRPAAAATHAPTTPTGIKRRQIKNSWILVPATKYRTISKQVVHQRDEPDSEYFPKTPTPPQTPVSLVESPTKSHGFQADFDAPSTSSAPSYGAAPATVPAATGAQTSSGSRAEASPAGSPTLTRCAPRQRRSARKPACRACFGTFHARFPAPAEKKAFSTRLGTAITQFGYAQT